MGLAEHLAQWLECPMKCFTQGESDGLELKPLAMKSLKSSNDGNWWYDRSTFACELQFHTHLNIDFQSFKIVNHSVVSQSPILATLIDHDAKTRIRLGKEDKENPDSEIAFDDDLADCMSACHGDEGTE